VDYDENIQDADDNAAYEDNETKEQDEEIDEEYDWIMMRRSKT
jgi:hypothetical protein